MDEMEQIKDLAFTGVDILANDINQHCADLAENYCGDTHCVACLASALYTAGYRKQSEEKKPKGCEYCKGRAYTKKPLTVITKYGRRIELVFEFCPNCGRKMKGGAE